MIDIKKINDIERNILKLEKDLVEQKELVLKLKNETYKVGDEVKYCDLDWIVIKTGILTETSIIQTKMGITVKPHEEQIVTLMLKNKLNKEQLKKCGYNPDSYNDIAFNSDKSNNDWQESDVRKCAIKFANEYLNVYDLKEMITNYDEDKYSKDFIRIPTLREIERLSKNIRKVDADTGYWTMTASYGATDTDYYAFVFRVYSSGDLNYGSNVSGTYGVRPVITLSADKL